MKIAAAAIIYGKEGHHIDHLAPLCHILDIPLIVTDEEIEVLIKTYYPPIEVIQIDTSHIAVEFTKRFDVAFSCMPRPLFEEIFFFAEHFLRKKVMSIWCPHGNSDKGHKVPSMEGLKRESFALIYGPRMKHFLIDKGAFSNLQGHVQMGNMRLEFYEKQKEFYTYFTDKFACDGPQILFAPTWEDAEDSSSLFAAASILIENLPKPYRLIIKPHPNLFRQQEAKLLWLMGKYEHLPHVLFIENFPPIYPLIHQADIYIGDMSSVGYDFLSYNRPMFFLNQNKRSLQDPGLHLYKCGVAISPEDYPRIYDIMREHLLQDQTPFKEVRVRLYQETFGQKKSLGVLKEEMNSLCVQAIEHMI